MKVCCYNIQMLPWKIKFYSTFIKYIEQFDIIFLQEAFYNINIFQGKRKILQMLERRNYHVSYSKLPNLLLGEHITDAGLIIASKYPIIESTFYPFKNHCNVDSLSQKGYIHSIIHTKKGKINLINTHLQSFYSEENNWFSGINSCERKAQLSQFFLFIQSLKDDVLIGGDFNLHTQEEIDFFHDMSNIKKLNTEQSGIDFILSTLKIEKIEDNKEIVKKWSDHEPLSVEIKTK